MIPSLPPQANSPKNLASARALLELAAIAEAVASFAASLL
jgi:hypothetical protein